MRFFKLLVGWVLLLLFSALPGKSFAGKEAPWPQPGLRHIPLTPDGYHLLEGTSAAPLLSWHARLSASYAYGVGAASRASQLSGALAAGLGLPFKFELALALPMAWTIGTKTRDSSDQQQLEAMGDDGIGLGDLTAGLLFGAYGSAQGGLSILIGLSGSAPTGNHERLIGEGGFLVEPFSALAFQVLGSRLCLNLAYRLRPEHIMRDENSIFEQDDEIVWRAGLRVPRRYDVAWSLEMEWDIQVARREGIWPSSAGRPFFAGAGLDFPVGREQRLGIVAGARLVGKAMPSFFAELSLLKLPVLPDEDGDGISGSADSCPLLKEDRDGFEDSDGCPDLDNDKDGFPDDEDRCPMTKAGGLSEDGC